MELSSLLPEQHAVDPVGGPEVEGLRLGGRTTLGGRGEVFDACWSDEVAPDGASSTGGQGWPLQVCILRMDVRGSARDRAQQLLEPYLDVRHEHLVPLLAVVRWHDGLALVQPAAAATTLAEVVGSRRLSAGQVVTLALPLLDALAELHAGGLRHGGTAVDDVLVDAAGRPLLAGAGVRAALGSAGTVGEDAACLVEMLASAADPEAVRALRPLESRIAGGVDDVHALRAPLLALAEPVPLVPGVQRAERPAPRDRRRALPGRRTAVAIGVLGGLVAAAVAVGWVSTAQPSGAPPPAPAAAAAQPSAAPVPPPDWLSVLRALDRRRSQAFASLRPALLDEVDAPGPARIEDHRLMQQLVAAGWRARGLALQVTDVRQAGSTATRTVLRVRDTLRPYTLIDASGSVARTIAGRGPRSHDVVLVAGGANGWRVESVRDVSK